MWWAIGAAAAGVGAAVAGTGLWRRMTTRGPRAALPGELPGGVGDVPRALLQATGTELTDGNHATLVEDGDVFESIAAAVRDARRSIHVDIFIWKPGEPGDWLADLVAERARAGVAVRILVDPIGSPGFAEELRPRLTAAGCEVKYFRPLKHRPLTLTGRNHRKIVTVDGRVGFTGGFGIAPEWTGRSQDPKHWRDTNVRVEGPVVRQLQLAFAAHWLESGGGLIPDSEFEGATPAGTQRAAFVTSMDVKGLSSARWISRIVLAAARRRVWIANAYFVPLPTLLDGLCATGHRGVDVQLLLPGPVQDHPMVTVIQRLLYPRLRRGGVRVHEFQPTMLHSKTILVDDSLVVVGSMNLDPLSQSFLEEGALVVLDEDFAREMAASFERDFARARPVVTPKRLAGLGTLPLPRTP